MPWAVDEEPSIKLHEALSDLGWFSRTFAVIVSGPSILTILQQVYVEYRLVNVFQWIVDGYHRMVGIAGAIIVPLVQPSLEWVNATFGWSLTLHAHWVPLFALGMVVVLSAACATEIPLAEKIAIACLYAFLVLVGALLAGLAPLRGAWWTQALAATLPLLPVLIASAVLRVSHAQQGQWQTGQRFTLRPQYMTVSPALTQLSIVGSVLMFIVFLGLAGALATLLLSLAPDFVNGAGIIVLGLTMLGLTVLIMLGLLFLFGLITWAAQSSTIAGNVLTLIVFLGFAGAFAAVLSRVPGFASGAGIIVLGFMVLSLGVQWISTGLRLGRRAQARQGLITVGGFVAAASIAGASEVVRLLS